MVEIRVFFIQNKYSGKRNGFAFVRVDFTKKNHYTLFEIFIFVQKFHFDFPRKLSIFLGEKLVKMLWFWTF